ncbi:MAG: efflux RND transporter permease subunit [Spirochaetota bacterium]|nr:MAG: efflux RND transporter permease subunit [Spirochaetota bacterium]
MKLSDLSVNRPVTTVVIFLALIVLGVYSLTQLAIDLIPDISFPVIAVFTSYEGVAPQEIEENITKVVENAAAAASNVKKITSNSREGQSVVTVEYEWGTDMGEAAAELREKLDLVRDYLPDDANQPVLFKFDPSMIPIMVLIVEGERDLKSLRYITERNIKSNFEQIDGVANVQVWGGLERQVHVDLDRTLLASYGLTVDQIINIIRAEHINISGGEVTEGGATYALRTVGKFRSIEELESIAVTNKNGIPVLLKDVAGIYDGFVEEEVDALIEQEDGIIMTVQKQSGTNTVQVANLMEKKIAALEASLPPDINIRKFYSPSDFIKDSINNVWQVALIGGALAIFVLLLFLRNLPTTLIISVSIPLSVIVTFIFMYLFNLTLNMMSLGGLALGIGMLVDNSIVVLENIFRYREFGAKRHEAAKLGTQEMSNAIIASTLTTVAVFLPLVFFIQGMAKELFRDLAFTVTFSLLSSLLVALTVVPMLSSNIKKVKVKKKVTSLLDVEAELEARGKVLRFLDRVYKSILGWALAHRGWFIAMVLVVFIVSLGLIRVIGVEFMPESDEGFVRLNIQTPIGTDIDSTRSAVKKIYNIISERVPERDVTFSQVGRSGEMIGTEAPNTAEVWITLVDLAERKRSDKEVIEDLRKEIQKIPGVKVRFSTGGGPTGGSSNLSVILSGYDLVQGKILAEKLQGIMEGVKNVRDVKISREEGLPEYQVKIDRERAALFGLNAFSVGQAVKRAFAGESVANVILGGEEVDVFVRLEEEDRITSRDLELVSVASPFGTMVPLSSFTELIKDYGPVNIERERQERVIYVNARVLGDVKGAVDAIKSEVANIVIPPGFTIQYGGSWEDLQETIRDLVIVGILAIILVYLIMAAQFESFFDPFIIMFTLPMTFIGVVWMHIITGLVFSAVSAIGIVVLLGIVVNNGIILVDYTNLLRKRGHSLLDAVMLAGRTRLRPILMTMLTTVLALVPMALALGAGGEMYSPMAKTVIGGLLVATVFTLVLIPVLYAMFEGAKLKRMEKRLKKAGAQ